MESISPAGIAHIVELIGKGKKVEAFNWVRTFTGKGPKEAKQEIDAIEELFFGK